MAAAARVPLCQRVMIGVRYVARCSASIPSTPRQWHAPFAIAHIITSARRKSWRQKTRCLTAWLSLRLPSSSTIGTSRLAVRASPGTSSNSLRALQGEMMIVSLLRARGAAYFCEGAESSEPAQVELALSLADAPSGALLPSLTWVGR